MVLGPVGARLGVEAEADREGRPLQLCEALHLAQGGSDEDLERHERRDWESRQAKGKLDLFPRPIGPIGTRARRSHGGEGERFARAQLDATDVHGPEGLQQWLDEVVRADRDAA